MNELTDNQWRLLELIDLYGVSGPFERCVEMPDWAGEWHGKHFHQSQAATDAFRAHCRRVEGS